MSLLPITEFQTLSTMRHQAELSDMFIRLKSMLIIIVEGSGYEIRVNILAVLAELTMAIPSHISMQLCFIFI